MTTYLQSIRHALLDEMRRDPKVFLIGEDVGQYGGAFKLTAGFLEQFGPERVIDSPITEGALISLAAGAALMGLRPVVEMQFMDFMACGFNQLTNLVAKFHYRTGVPLPLVVRGPYGAGLCAGPFHSQSPEGYLLHTPGLKVVTPATSGDAGPLLRAAVRDDDPVIFLEHKALYRKLKDEINQDDSVAELGRAQVKRTGTDITLITYGACLHVSMEAALKVQEKEGISLEIIDLRTLAPLDQETLTTSVRKTSKAMVVHEAPETGGPAAEIAARLNETLFDALDGPVLRVTAPDTPVPYHCALEQKYLPQVEDVIMAARWLARY